MASYCPKCGYKLSLVDVKPECPVCGVNLVYYGIEDTLKKEADKAEFEHATFQPHVDRLKAGTVGSPLAVVRLVLCLLPLAATLAPMGTVIVTLPFFTESVTINIISVVEKVFMNLDFNLLLSLMGDANAGSAYIFYAVAIVSLVMIVLMALLNIINLIFAEGKKGIKRNITVASIGLFFTVLGTVMQILYLNGLSNAVPEIFSGSFAPWGAIAVGATFIAEIVINVIYKKKNIKVKYKDLSEYLISYDERTHSKSTQEEAVQTAAEG